VIALDVEGTIIFPWGDCVHAPVGISFGSQSHSAFDLIRSPRAKASLLIDVRPTVIEMSLFSRPSRWLAAVGTMFRAGRSHDMNEFRFDPPIMLQSNVAVSTLREAAAFTRSFQGARMPEVQASILRRLESARTAEERRAAADGFRGWAKLEGLLLKP
jgi:hypothetical protein